MTEPPTVLLADDHPLVLRGLADLLAGDGGVRVLASCRDGQAALDAAHEIRPDIAVVDFNMPRLDGLGFLRAARSSGLPTRVILLTAELADNQIYDAVNGGVAGLVFKDSAPDTLLDCIREVSAGRRWLPETVDAAISRESERRQLGHGLWKSLTEREREIAILAAENLSNKEVARRLDIAEGTVKIHLNHIYGKLRVASRTALLALVRRFLDQRPDDGDHKRRS